VAIATIGSPTSTISFKDAVTQPLILIEIRGQGFAFEIRQRQLSKVDRNVKRHGFIRELKSCTSMHPFSLIILLSTN
jgi:hypothetical protein